MKRPLFPMPYPEMSDASRIEVFLDILHNPTCLEEYAIGSPADHHEVQHVHEAWATFAPNLQMLRLFMASGSFHAFVPPPGIQFANLRMLKLLSTMQTLPSADIPLRLVPICEFINGLHETLEEFHISGVISSWFDQLFQRLHHFKRLHSLAIREHRGSLEFPVTISQGVPEFINKHQAEIHHLSLSFFIPPFELSKLHLSNFTSLQISPGTLVDNWDRTKDFFHNVSHSLAKLSIWALLPRRDLYILLSSFPTENCLKTLVLSQRTFDAGLILVLASYLPKLRSLTLHVDAEALKSSRYLQLSMMLVALASLPSYLSCVAPVAIFTR